MKIWIRFLPRETAISEWMNTMTETDKQKFREFKEQYQDFREFLTWDQLPYYCDDLLNWIKEKLGDSKKFAEMSIVYSQITG